MNGMEVGMSLLLLPPPPPTQTTAVLAMHTGAFGDTRNEYAFKRYS